MLEKKNELEVLAKELLEKEILYQSDLEGLIGKRPFEKETTYEKYTNSTNDSSDEEEMIDKVKQEVKDEVKQEEASKD